MKILVTNDDGIHSRGIQALTKELSGIAELYLVAPDRERSGTGHSITVFDPIRVVRTSVPGVKQAWIVGGTPVDCVKIAIARLIEENIDLVISGINHGSNLGSDVLYSGTVSAAAEGVIMGCPSLAISLDSDRNDDDFEFAAQFTRQLVATLMRWGIEPQTMVNINIPALARSEIKGIRVSKLGLRNYDNLFEERQDPRGNTYYWLGGGVLPEEQDPASDVYAVEHSYISVTPINLDLTNYPLISRYKDLAANFQKRLFPDLESSD
ncbi:MAG TPA: 5'/3'-nucleotidase SurE [Syntrophomonas sp.]|nr:5'/3'-nucleotidase SurE [Syntrophomonas sp.]